MFKVGDKVVYPMHGAGVIESIEEHEVLGRREKYYILKMPLGDMKVMIPMCTADAIGIREIIKPEDADLVLRVLRENSPSVCENWNKRYRENLDKIKSGDIMEVAKVVRSLTVRERRKGLSTGERKMLANAKQILISELVLAKGMSPQQVEKLIDQNVG